MIAISRATYTSMVDLMQLPLTLLAELDAEVYEYCEMLQSRR